MVSYAADVFSRLVSNFHIDPPPPPRKRAADGVAVDRSQAESGAAPRAISGTIVETDIPARLDSLPFGRFHLLVIVALGITWILDGLEVTLAGHVVRRAQGQLRLGPEQCANRPCGKLLSRRRRARRILLRLADRSPRPQKAIHDHARRLPSRDCGDRAVVECVELFALPLSHRRRHRRRIHRHQFDNPGAYPGAVPRLDRPPDQRQLSGSVRRSARAVPSSYSIPPSSIRQSAGGSLF